MKNSNYLIVVLIDDIDRLFKDDLLQMFSLIKSVADLPNIVYILAFDETIVAGMTPSGYLEKIIQASYEVPAPDRWALKTFFLQKLSMSKALLNKSHTGSDPRFWEILDKGIVQLLKTPRDVIRLINGFELNYPAVRDEVNLADFIGLECIRLNASEIYRLISANPEHFSGNVLPHAKGLQEFHKSLEESALFKEVSPLVKHIFPKCAFAINKSSKYHFDGAMMRADNRAACLEKFEFYFKLSSQIGLLNNAQFRALLSIAEQEPERFFEQLESLAKQKRLDGYSKYLSFAEALYHADTNFSDLMASNIVKALIIMEPRLFVKVDEIKISEELLLPPAEQDLLRKMDYIGLEMGGTVVLIRKLLAYIKDPSALLLQASQKIDHLGIITELVDYEFGSSAPALSPDILDSVVKAIKDMFTKIKSEEMQRIGHPRTVYSFWCKWGDTKKLNELIHGLNAHQTLQLVCSHLVSGSSHQIGSFAGAVTLDLHIDYLLPYLDETTLSKIFDTPVQSCETAKETLALRMVKENIQGLGVYLLILACRNLPADMKISVCARLKLLTV